MGVGARRAVQRRDRQPASSAGAERSVDKATGVALSPTLDVDVSDADDDTLTVSFYGRPVSTTSNPPFSLVIIPDTQYYSSSQNGGTPAIFRSQTDWIVDNMGPLSLAFVAHVGDIVDHGDTYPAEWDSA